MKVLIDNWSRVEFTPRYQDDGTVCVNRSTTVDILIEWQNMSPSNSAWGVPPVSVLADHFAVVLDSELAWLTPVVGGIEVAGVEPLYSLANIDTALGGGILDWSDSVQDEAAT